MIVRACLMVGRRLLVRTGHMSEVERYVIPGIPGIVRDVRLGGVQVVGDPDVAHRVASGDRAAGTAGTSIAAIAAHHGASTSRVRAVAACGAARAA